MRDNDERAAPRRVLLPSVIVAVVVWGLMALAQGMPTLCLLARPCPAADVRLAPALLYGSLMLVPLLAIAWVSQRPHQRGWLAAPAYIVFGILALVGLASVLFSGGFFLALPW